MNACILPLLATLFVNAADPSDAKKERVKLQGTWVYVEGEEVGHKIGGQDAKEEGWIFVVKGDSLTITKKGEKEGEFSISVDPTKKPAAMDLTIMEGKSKGKKNHAIYSLHGFLTNKGKTLATSVEVRFPPFVRLLDPDTLFDPTDSFPIRPRPPEKPSISDILGSTPLIAPLASILPNSAVERKGPRVFMRNEDKPKVSVTLDELIHKNTPTKLRTITFWFPNNERPRTFGASYSALCAELPESLEKHLLFEIAGA